MQKEIEQAIELLRADYMKTGGKILSSDRKIMLHQLHNLINKDDNSEGMCVLKKCVREKIKQAPSISNSKIAQEFDIESYDFSKRNKGWFVWVITKKLEKQGEIIRGENKTLQIFL